MNRYVIYKLTSPSGRSYIGCTMHYKKRMWQHSTSTDNYPIHKAIRKYGWENITKEIVMTVGDPKLLGPLEIFCIQFYNTYNSGYNQTLGGDGMPGHHKSVETRKKMSDARKGRIISEETIIKLRIAKKKRDSDPNKKPSPLKGRKLGPLKDRRIVK